MINKPILTTGVMVALALIQAASIVGMGLVEEDFPMAGKAFLKLLLEIAIVAVFSGLVFLLKRFSMNKRRFTWSLERNSCAIQVEFWNQLRIH